MAKGLTSLPANKSSESFARLPDTKLLEFKMALADVVVHCSSKFGVIPDTVYSVKDIPEVYYVRLDDVVKEK